MSGDGPYKRVLLKLSGEALMGDGEFGLDTDTVGRVAADIAAVHGEGNELCVVVGGGNIFRGVSVAAKGMERTTADYMGMLATVMNALAMQSALEALDVPTRVLSAIPMDTVCEPYIRRRAVRHMEKGRGGDLCSRHRQPLLHDGYGRCIASVRNGLRLPDERDEGRRCLFGRPRERLVGRTV